VPSFTDNSINRYSGVTTFSTS